MFGVLQAPNRKNEEVPTVLVARNNVIRHHEIDHIGYTTALGTAGCSKLHFSLALKGS